MSAACPVPGIAESLRPRQVCARVLALVPDAATRPTPKGPDRNPSASLRLPRTPTPLPRGGRGGLRLLRTIPPNLRQRRITPSCQSSRQLVLSKLRLLLHGSSTAVNRCSRGSAPSPRVVLNGQRIVPHPAGDRQGFTTGNVRVSTQNSDSPPTGLAEQRLSFRYTCVCPPLNSTARSVLSMHASHRHHVLPVNRYVCHGDLRSTLHLQALLERGDAAGGVPIILRR